MTHRCLLLGVLLGFSGCRGEVAETPVTFEPFSFDPAGLEKVVAVQRQAISGWQPRPEMTALVDEYRAFNLRLAAGEGLEETFARLLGRVKELLGGVPAEKAPGEEAVRLVWWLTEKYQTAFDRVRRECPADCARAVCTGGDIRPEWREPLAEFLAWAGDFLPHACRSGLVAAGDQGLVLGPGADYLLRAAFKVRLAGLFNLPSEERDATVLFLHPEEQKLYYRWVVEGSPLADWERKLQAAVQLKRLDPRYPLALARGIIHYQAGFYQAALADFEFATSENPAHPKLKSWLAQARRRAAIEASRRASP